MANTVGSRHPFILKDEVESKVTIWKRSDRFLAGEIDERIALISDWVIDADKKLEAEV